MQFRLKRCGLRRPIYLVEECGSSAAHLSIPEATLQQAIVNTQVHTQPFKSLQIYSLTVHKAELFVQHVVVTGRAFVLNLVLFLCRWSTASL